MGVIVIGNKPFKNISLNKIIDSFDINYRCNMSSPNKNNGTKYHNLGLCVHLYSNLITNKVSRENFLKFYQLEYKEDEVIAFFDSFDKGLYNNVYFAKDNVVSYNQKLSTYGIGYRFTKQPRTGYTILFDRILASETVFISNFSVEDESRESYYVKETAYETECHSKEDELKIIRWLHNNGKIDATLCMLVDSKELTLNCKGMKPTKFILEELLKEHDHCVLIDVDKDISVLEELVNAGYIMEIRGSNIYIINKKV